MEEFFTWRAEWSTGIEALDSQHEELARQLNRLVSTCSNPGDDGQTHATAENEPLTRLADGLHNHIKALFRHEQEMMLEVEYPEYAAHAREHTMLLAELRTILHSETKRGSTCISTETLLSLRAWFVAHIVHSDRKFGFYVLNHNTLQRLTADSAESN